MKTKPRRLSIEVKSGSIIAGRLSDMHKNSFGNHQLAERIFGSGHLSKYKIDPSDIIEVTGMGEHPSNDTCQFNYIVTKPVDNDEIEQPVKKPPINKTIIIRIDAWTDKEMLDNAMAAFVNQTGYSYDGYWWVINKKSVLDRNLTEFTLTNPCKHLGDLELMHKPMNIRGDISSEPVPEPKQPDIVYIAGAISGDIVANRHRFAAAKHSIMASSANTTVLNPAELPDGLTKTQYMSICLPMVMMSTSLFMLKGWEKSEGAVAEHALAQKLKIEIVYQGEHDGKL